MDYYWHQLHVKSSRSPFPGVTIKLAYNDISAGTRCVRKGLKLRHKTASERAITAALSRLCVPLYYLEIVANQILLDAERYVRGGGVAGNMWVDVDLYDDDFEEEEEEENLDEMVLVEDMGEPRFEAASKSWISNNLKRVKILNGSSSTGSSNSMCPVCREEIKVGDEEIRMPCSNSHVYHGDCIVKWLQLSRLCPECRYAVPAADDCEDQELKEANLLNSPDR